MAERAMTAKTAHNQSDAAVVMSMLATVYVRALT